MMDWIMPTPCFSTVLKREIGTTLPKLVKSTVQRAEHTKDSKAAI